MLSPILIATLLVSLCSFSGAIFLLKKKLLSEKMLTYFVSFAAGVLLVTALMDLLPEAIVEIPNGSVTLPMLLGIVTFFFLERFILWFHHHDEPHGTHPSVMLILLGDGIHNIIDGVAIAATFLVTPALGITTTLAIAAHEIPHEIADFTVLIHGGLNERKALFYNFLSALTSFVGAIAGYLYLQRIHNLLPYLLSFSAGMFIYIACSDLIPDMHKDFQKQKGWMQVVPFLGGILLTYISIQFLEH